MFTQQIYLLNILKTRHILRFFSLQDAVYFIMLSFLVPVIFTFYTECAKILEENSGAKGLYANKENFLTRLRKC